MKIIITGATGAFGAAMTRHFSRKGHEIIATGRAEHAPTNLLQCATTYLSIDITRPFELPAADVCIHAAALSDDKGSINELYAPNVIGTKNALKAAVNCKKFIHISSSSVYLPQQDSLKEEVAGKQNNNHLSPYGNSKLQAETEILENYKGKSCFILRPRAFYGPGDIQIIPRLMKLVKNNVFVKPGKLDIKFSMTHYKNMADAIECCIDSDLKGIRIYNVADPEVYIMIEALRKIFEAVYGTKLGEKGINILLIKALAFFRIGGISPLLVRALTRNMVLDISKIQSELGYKGKIRFEDSLAEIGNWVKDIGGAEVLENPAKSLVWDDTFTNRVK